MVRIFHGYPFLAAHIVPGRLDKKSFSTLALNPPVSRLRTLLTVQIGDHGGFKAASNSAICVSSRAKIF